MNTETQNAKPTVNFSNLLETVLKDPGLINAAYTAFHDYSVMNQWSAMIQCMTRNLQVGPLCTFKGWQAKGRCVKKGEKAIQLCMPITGKKKAEGKEDVSFTFFAFKNNWFTLAQTEGEAFQAPSNPEWNKEAALGKLGITEIPFTQIDGNKQGYRIGNCIAINPLASLPHKTLFHEIAHALLHTSEAQMNDSELNRADVKEMEAECTAYLCIEALGLAGGEYSRGYVQNWYHGEKVPEKNAKRIIGAVNKILNAGKPAKAEKIKA